jgi:membrane-bound ClpP family serine protease
MELILIVGLIVLAIIFLLLEVFLIPGISIAGIGSALCFIAGIYLAYIHLGVVTGTWILGISLLITGGILYGFFKSKTLDKIALDTKIDSQPEPYLGKEIKPGDIGVTVSRLAPIGNVQFVETIVEGRSINEMIEPGAKVVAVEIGPKNIMVRKVEA